MCCIPTTSEKKAPKESRRLSFRERNPAVNDPRPLTKKYLIQSKDRLGKMWTVEALRCLHTSSSTTRPLVLLLGWLGAQERYLTKYTELYEDLGAQTVTMQPTLLQTAWPSAANRAAVQFAQEIAESPAGQGRGPVLVQCMSNAGWLAFGAMLHLTNLAASDQRLPDPISHQTDSLLHFKTSVLDRLSAIVVDSAPSHATPDIWARGSVSAALKKPAFGIEVENPMTLAIGYKVAERYLALPSISRHLRETRAAWGQLSPMVPQLYLYSSADVLVPAAHVEAFMTQQAYRGVAVAHHCWDDSGHCEHLRDHPEQYKRIVHSFVERSLTDIGAAVNAI